MTDSQKWLWFAASAAIFWLLYLLAPVFTPFLVSALFAYLGDPLADRLEKHRFSRTAAVIVVFLFMFLLLFLALIILVPMIERQVTYLVAKLPEYLKWFQNVAIPWVANRLGIENLQVDMTTLKDMILGHWQQAGGVAASIVKSISTSGLAFLGWLSSLVLIPVVTFYLLRDWDRLIARLHEMVPRKMEKTIAKITCESDEVLGAFLRGQFLVMIALGTVYSVGLWIVGLKLSLLIGMISGLVSFVPYLGFIVGIVTAGIAIILQTHDVLQLVPILIVFGIGQLLEGMLLTPWLVGDRIGLHPVAVIFAVLAGAQLFGFFGILLALPVAAVIAVILRHAHQHYLSSHMYDKANPKS